MIGKEFLRIDGELELLELLKPWLIEHGAKYKSGFGWYFEECARVPVLPIGLTATRQSLTDNESITGSFLGVIDERLTIPVTSIGASRNPSRPSRFLYIFADKQDNKIAWFTTQRNIEINKSYDLTGTVKRHSIYNNERQTVVTNCRLEERGMCNG